MESAFFGFIALKIATFCGIGYVKFAPGTLGAFFALPIAWCLSVFVGQFFFLVIALLFFFIGIWASNIFIKNEKSGNKDPSSIVIDEVVGVWLTLMPFNPSLSTYILGFVLFRFFDILKPCPISLADKSLKGGFGVMFDDVLAALYSIICLFYLLEIMMF